jgi:hypothetical protein
LGISIRARAPGFVTVCNGDVHRSVAGARSSEARRKTKRRGVEMEEGKGLARAGTMGYK